MKIAICDDDLKDIENIRNHILTHSRSHEIVEFTSAEPFLKRSYSGEHFDMLFLDIQMPDSDGWEIAKEMKKYKTKPYIAMVSVLGERIRKCFDRVDWFAEKPISRETAHLIIDDAYEKLYPKAFSFKTDNNITVSLTCPEIIYAEAMRNYLSIHSTSGKYKIRLTMHELTDILLGFNCFVRPHNSYIVNLAHYSESVGNEIILKNGKKISVSRKNKKAFYDSLAEYIRGSRK